MAKTLREFGLQSDALIGSPEATQFLTTMKPAGTPGALSQTPSTAPITSADVTSTPAPQFKTESNPSVSTVVKTEDFAPPPLGPKATEASDLIKKIQGIDTSGQAAYQAELQQAPGGLTDLQKQEADIFSQ